MKNLFTPNSKSVLGILLSASLMLSACDGELELVQSIDEEFSGISHIDLESGFLAVNYEGIAGQTEVIMEGILESSRPGNYKIEYDVEGNTLIIGLDQVGVLGVGNHRGILNITGPKDLELNIASGSGTIRVFGIEHPKLSVISGSGSIQVHLIKSPSIKLKAGSGSIEGYNLIGNLDVESSSGGVVIDQMEGDLDILASSGSVNVKTIYGKLNSNLSSGNLQMDNVEEIEVLKVSSGTISGTRIGLGPKTQLISSSGRIEIQTISDLGDFNYDFQAGSGKVIVGQSSSSGVLKINNGSAHTISGSVSSGKIEIRN